MCSPDNPHQESSIFIYDKVYPHFEDNCDRFNLVNNDSRTLDKVLSYKIVLSFATWFLYLN